METRELVQIRALLNLAAISRKEAANRLNLSASGLNKKMRGEIRLTQREKDQLCTMASERMQ